MVKKWAWYNEHDKFAAAWLRELIKAGLIADGEVDERSIADVQPDDVRGFTQCHFFAGIGGWSYALRLAGWDDARPVWTGSCPCQPFSEAGKGDGAADPRDLWPAWFQLLKKCRPLVVFGEQVESALRHGWFDRLCDDLEREGYAIGACGLPGPSVGAFDIRARLWFVADAGCGADERLGRSLEASRTARSDGREVEQRQWRWPATWSGRSPGRMAYTEHSERRPLNVDREDGRDWSNDGRQEAHGEFGARGEVRDVAGADCGRLEAGDSRQRAISEPDEDGAFGDMGDANGSGRQDDDQRRADRTRRASAAGSSEGRAGEVGDSGRSGFWDACDWIDCRDGKVRPVEPGTFPLAYGLPARVGRLRGYGNAIKPQVAQVFIEAYMECVNGS